MSETKVLQTTNRSNSLRLDRVIIRTGHFERPLQTQPRDFFESELGCQLSRADHRGEARGSCCFHRSKSRRSFVVNLRTGIWFCFGCNFGGDQVSFLRRRYGFSYVDAARYLGTLENGPPVQVPTELVPFLTFDFVVDGVNYRASAKDQPRNYADKIRRFYRRASDRLVELGRGDPEAYAGEEENCWAQMVCAVDEGEST